MLVLTRNLVMAGKLALPDTKPPLECKSQHLMHQRHRGGFCAYTQRHTERPTEADSNTVDLCLQSWAKSIFKRKTPACLARGTSELICCVEELDLLGAGLGWGDGTPAAAN